MNKVMMILGKEIKEESGSFQETDAHGIAYGQLSDRPKEELLQYLSACHAGTLRAVIDGKRYKITEIMSNGRFKAEPDF